MTAQPHDGVRSALVTGASSGIGFAIAEMLLHEGFAVTAVARQPEKLADAVERLGASGGVVVNHPANMANEDEIIEAFQAHGKRFGRIDVLVNNAGLGIDADPLQAPTKHIDLQLNINLRTVMISYREARDLLLAAAAATGSGVVVNMSSILAHRQIPSLAVYSAAKAALVSYTESMNGLLARHGVRSTAICPSYVDTPMADWTKRTVAADQMIPTSDIVEIVQMLLALSPMAVISNMSVLCAYEL